MTAAVLGICVGGRGRRMGGVQKALLPAPDGQGTLLARLSRLGREAGLEVVLLGAADLGVHATGLAQLPDFAPEVGPLAGLASLLRHAGARPAVCLACDMPFVEAALLARLVREQPEAEVLAPRAAVNGKWEPLFARYHGAHVAPVLAETLRQGERSFQALFGRLNVCELGLSASERASLRDWDTPEDMRARQA
jgi:molybdopterin-guanine dinucleotide biosynthesis protein A